MRGLLLNRLACALALVGLLACGRPEPLPDVALQPQGAPGLNPSTVRELEVEHTGCFGPCSVYRVRITDSGQIEYEGKRFVRQIGRLNYSLYPATVAPLFTWLHEHAALYAASADRRHGVDLEELTIRFRLKTGQTVIIESNIGFVGDDLWALSNIVDGVVLRAMIHSKEESGEPKPAT
jgi:hypothetical protein